jgi:hypothetical protein
MEMYYAVSSASTLTQRGVQESTEELRYGVTMEAAQGKQTLRTGLGGPECTDLSAAPLPTELTNKHTHNLRGF